MYTAKTAAMAMADLSGQMTMIKPASSAITPLVPNAMRIAFVARAARSCCKVIGYSFFSAQHGGLYLNLPLLCSVLHLRGGPGDDVITHNDFYFALVVGQYVEITGIDLQRVAFDGARGGFNVF